MSVFGFEFIKKEKKKLSRTPGNEVAIRSMESVGKLWVPDLLASLGYTGRRRVVLDHTVNKETLMRKHKH